ncbi:MAG: T9SS type A sorting domain-containing protein [Flammeovirgaceae bacterium]|nr:T9SS type A sorting domain-containing protein [Flammeovirgaceae bacterium]MDW8288033.1 T9SS type A sorting domain-containing protein [Flammeovirgaceae bacterium]
MKTTLLVIIGTTITSFQVLFAQCIGTISTNQTWNNTSMTFSSCSGCSFSCPATRNPNDFNVIVVASGVTLTINSNSHTWGTGSPTYNTKTFHVYGEIFVTTAVTNAVFYANFEIFNGGELQVDGDLRMGGAGDCNASASPPRYYINLYQGGNINSQGSGASDKLRICNNTILQGGGGCSTCCTGSPPYCTDGSGITGGPGGIGFGPGGQQPLPVILVSFSAKVAGNAVKLFWQTAKEYNNERFEIERSSNGMDFEKIGEVKGAGTTNLLTNYVFVDEKPFNNLSYYRLKQIDTDGHYEYSRVVFVNLNEKAEIKGIYPNPTYNGSFFINYTYSNFKEAFVTIYDLMGMKMHQQRFVNYEGGDVFVSNHMKMSAGVYIVEIVIDGERKVEKLNVQ